MAPKRDVKQFRQACKELGLTDEERFAARDALHAEKEGGFLRGFRGLIADARIAYPEVLHVEVRDQAGKLWRFATQDAEFTPSDPGRLAGQTLEHAEIDPNTAELRCRFADGSQLLVMPAAQEAADDPPNWELITPDHLTLEFGPGLRWQIGRSDASAPSSG